MARQANREADQGRYPTLAFRGTDIVSMGLSHFHTTTFTVYRWLAAFFDDADVPNETAILSESGLSPGAAESDIFQLALLHAQPATSDVSQSHRSRRGRKAGRGRPR